MTLTTLLIILVFLIGLYFYARCADPKYAEGFTNQSFQARCPNLLIQKGSKFYLYNSKLAQVPGVNPIEFENLEDYTEFLDWQKSQGIRCPVLYLQGTYDAQGNQVYKVRPSVSEPQAGLPPSSAASVGIASQVNKFRPSVSEPQGGLPPSTAAPVGIASQVTPMLESSMIPNNGLLHPNPTLLVDATRNDPPYNKGGYPAYDETSYYVGTSTPLDQMNTKQEQALISPDPMDPNWGGSEYTQSLVDKGYYKQNEVSIAIP